VQRVSDFPRTKCIYPDALDADDNIKSGRGHAVKCDTLGTSAVRHGALQPRRATLPRRSSVRLQKAVDWRVHVVISVAALQAQDE